MNALMELKRIRRTVLQDLEKVQLEVDAIDKTIGILERRQNQELEHIVNGKEFSNQGLTDGCRQIVGSEFISPLEVRNRLLAGGYPIKSTKGKFLGSVYSTLKRIEKNGELEARKEDGRWCFRKRSPKSEIT